MADLSTTYMGVKLSNPIIVGACGMTANLETIRQIDWVGAGALVTKSLFEEQIQLKHFKFDEDREKYGYRHPEMIEVGPTLEFQGPKEHLMWVREAKRAVDIPVFASLNAVNRETWLEYAQRLAETGVDGLECNFFAAPRDPGKSGSEIEDEQVALVAELKNTIALPLSIKLSPFYTNILEVVHRMDQAGADAFVLFNRMFELDIDLHTETTMAPFAFSDGIAGRLPLRYTALLEGAISADLCCSSGIDDGEQALKMILAGAKAVQVVSALYGLGLTHIRTMLETMRQWMEAKNHKSLAGLRGKLSQRHLSQPNLYSHGQYASLLMHPETIVNNAPVL